MLPALELESNCPTFVINTVVDFSLDKPGESMLHDADVPMFNFSIDLVKTNTQCVCL